MNTLNMAAVVIENGFSIFVVLCLVALILGLMFTGINMYKHISSRYSTTVERIQNEHRSERKDWANENRKSVQNVELVLTSLTSAIQTANEQSTIQINNGGSQGTQGQKGNNEQHVPSN